MHFEIPAGLTDLLQEFTVAVLRRKPDDLVEFASIYFTEQKERRDGEQQGISHSAGKGVRFPSDEEKDGQYSDSDESDFGYLTIK